MGLTQIEILRCASALAKPAARAKLAALEAVVAKDKAIQQHFRELFKEGSPDIVLDTNRTSLQWRILDYCAGKGWIKSPANLLEKAFKSARKADVKQNRLLFLGGIWPAAARSQRLWALE